MSMSVSPLSDDAQMVISPDDLDGIREARIDYQLYRSFDGL